MSDRMSELEARVSELADSLRAAERRIAALEAAPPARPRAAAPRGAAATGGAAAANVGAELAWATTAISFAGRTLLVLAGAFLLRALTDAGTIPAWLGVGLGFAYAGVWIALADRASSGARAASAGFHGFSAAAIGFPLLFEAATRFRLLSPALAAVLLTGFTAVAMAVAVHRRFEVLAWVVALGGAATALALMPFGGRFAPPLLYLAVLGVATLWLGYVIDWRHLRWPVAIVADVAVLALVGRAVRPGAAEGPGLALFVIIVLLAGYLGSIATRTLLLNRPVVAFEVAQTAALVAVGLGGASFVAARTGMGALPLGVVSVVIGLAAYGVAFAFLERQAKKANFTFYTSVAIVFVLAGSALLAPGPGLGAAWAVLAVVSGVLARRSGKLTLAAHTAAYGVAATLASGLLGQAAGALLSSPTAAWPRPTAVSALVLALAAAAAWLASRAGARSGWPQRLPQLALVSAVAAGAAGLTIGWIAPLAAGAPGPGVDPGAVATVRTAVLVGGIFLLALLGRADAWVEARWLVVPLLVVCGLKLVLEDVARSRPATLFLAFALYGVALLVVPRLRRRDRARAAAPAAPPATQP
jgi:hypothetical protein